MIVIFILTKFGFFSMCKSHYWECVEVKHNQWTCLTNSKPRDANDKNSANHSLVYLIWGEQQILLPKITPNTLHPTDLVQKQWTRVPPNWGRPGFFFSLRSRDWKRGNILILFFWVGYPKILIHARWKRVGEMKWSILFASSWRGWWCGCLQCRTSLPPKALIKI